jgi:hypothetical protein
MVKLLPLSPPSGSLRLRSVQKAWITWERWQLDEKCLQNTNSKPGSVYRMVKLLPPRGATLVAVSASGLYKKRGLLENGGSWTRNVYRIPIANRGRSIEWSSYFRHAAPPCGSFRFRSVQKAWITWERWQLDEKCLEKAIANRGRSMELSSYFC